MGAQLGSGIAIGEMMRSSLSGATAPAASADDDAKYCASCGAKNPKVAKFCVECGGKLIQKGKCPACGAEVSGKSKFCPECGESLK